MQLLFWNSSQFVRKTHGFYSTQNTQSSARNVNFILFNADQRGWSVMWSVITQSSCGRKRGERFHQNPETRNQEPHLTPRVSISIEDNRDRDFCIYSKRVSGGGSVKSKRGNLLAYGMPEEEEAERFSFWVWDWFGTSHQTKSRSFFEEFFSFLLLIFVEMMITTRLCFLRRLIPLLLVFFFTLGIEFSFPSLFCLFVKLSFQVFTDFKALI